MLKFIKWLLGIGIRPKPKSELRQLQFFTPNV
jgi:hypothetical protein